MARGRDAYLATPWVESPFFEDALAARCDLDASARELARQYSEHGYVIVEDAIERDLLDRVRRETEGLFDPEVAEGPRSRYRVQDAWRESRAVADLALHPRVHQVLRLLYERTPIPFQTLDFRYGSQQVNHSDAILFNALPARFMCGVWVALEDVDGGNGPLFYHPGSHKLPEYGVQDFAGVRDESPDFFIGHRYPVFITELMQRRGFARETLQVSAGTFLVWASNLVHGGSPILEAGRTRWSQVTHYFFSDCLLYVPLYSDTVAGELHLRESHDFRTGQVVPQTFEGRSFSRVPLNNGRCRISIGDGSPAMPTAAPAAPESAGSAARARRSLWPRLLRRSGAAS